MSWIGDHIVLLSVLAFVLLIVAGVVVLVVRVLGLIRGIKTSKRTVDPHVATLTQSIGQAESRVGGITEGQGELSETLQRVSRQTAELGRLVSAASAAIAVLRAPLKYFGR